MGWGLVEAASTWLYSAFLPEMETPILQIFSLSLNWKRTSSSQTHTNQIWAIAPLIQFRLIHHVDTADTHTVLFGLTSNLPRAVFRLAKTLLKPTWTFLSESWTVLNKTTLYWYLVLYMCSLGNWGCPCLVLFIETRFISTRTPLLCNRKTKELSTSWPQ